MDYVSWLLLATSFFAGALNAVAGGGSFFTFPALIFAGIAPISANATCTIVLWPASITSIYAFRAKLRGNLHYLPKMAVIGLIGGLSGARTLLHTSDNDFSNMVPWLLLIATLIFAFGKQIAAIVLHLSNRFNHIRSILAVLLFFITAFYGGFFGAGIGILTLAVLYIMGMENIHEMNALKAMLVVIINSAAFFTFLLTPQTDNFFIAWERVLPMTCAAILGSYVGAKCSMQVRQNLVRGFVLLVATSTTIYFFIKQYG